MYLHAYSRNIGWVTEKEQLQLRQKRIAIAGLGGVGGNHLQTLTRLGIGAFNIADPDRFEPHNTNRQFGASHRSYNVSKSAVMMDAVKHINPELKINCWNEPITKDNVDEFLQDVDLFIDGIDFFNIDDRRALFAACAKKGIPAITAGPLGMGSAMMVFMPGQMTFDQYFQMQGHPKREQLLRFLIGLAPARLQARYVTNMKSVDLEGGSAPSTIMGCQFASGFAATAALKILLNRGKVPAAPFSIQFDAYTNRYRKTWRPWGNNNPLQQAALFVARRLLGFNRTKTQHSDEEIFIQHEQQHVQPQAQPQPATHG
jgi:molybdopterin/thiamine biosynthesis adenylyltransferase